MRYLCPLDCGLRRMEVPCCSRSFSQAMNCEVKNLRNIKGSFRKILVFIKYPQLFDVLLRTNFDLLYGLIIKQFIIYNNNNGFVTHFRVNSDLLLWESSAPKQMSPSELNDPSGVASLFPNAHFSMCKPGTQYDEDDEGKVFVVIFL